MIRGVEAVVLEEASSCSMSGSIVLGAGGYLTGKLETPADCCGSLSKMHGPQVLTSSTNLECRLSSRP